jgi:hypothetical protein
MGFRQVGIQSKGFPIPLHGLRIFFVGKMSVAQIHQEHGSFGISTCGIGRILVSGSGRVLRSRLGRSF